MAKKVVEAAEAKKEVYPDAVLGWHCASEQDGKFLCANGDGREIKIGESLTVTDHKKRIESRNYGFHCDSFDHVHQQFTCEYLQRVEVTGVADRDNSIFVGATRKCLGIVKSAGILKQTMAGLWKQIVADLREKYPEGPSLDEVNQALDEIVAGKKKNNQKLQEALKLTVVRGDRGRDGWCGYGLMVHPAMMRMGMMGMDMKWPEVDALQGINVLGEKFLKSVLDNRLDDLFDEAHAAMRALLGLEGVQMVMEKTQALSKALDVFYKGYYPTYVIKFLSEFLGRESDRISDMIQNYAKARAALDGMDATKLIAYDGGKFEEERKAITDKLWAQHEQNILAAAARSLETGKVVETL